MIAGVDNGGHILGTDNTGNTGQLTVDEFLSPTNSQQTRPQQTIEQFPDRVKNLQWQSSAARDQNDCSAVVTANMIYLATGQRPTIDDVLATHLLNSSGAGGPSQRDAILQHWGLTPTDYSHASVDQLAQLVQQGKVTDVAVNSSILRGHGNDGNGLDHVINVLGVKSEANGKVDGFYVVDTGVSNQVEYISYDSIKAATFNSTDIQTVDVRGGQGTTTNPSATPDVPITNGPDANNGPGGNQQSSPNKFLSDTGFNQGNGSGNGNADGSGQTPYTSPENGVAPPGGDTTPPYQPDPNDAALQQIYDAVGPQNYSYSGLNSWIGLLAGLGNPPDMAKLEELIKEGKIPPL